MDIKKCSVTNFGSYESLEFDFSNQGLTLIQGPTGAGKSTLQDAAAWCIYGITAKGGGVDDVRNWTSLHDPTTGYIEVDNLEIHRVRGKGKNDLYFVFDGELIRGKDIPDTQRMIEEALGVSEELYLLGAYFHEFSLSGKFFTSSAKDRRLVFEGVAHLQLATTIAERASIRRKTTKTKLASLTQAHSELSGCLKYATQNLKHLNTQAIAWDRTQAQTIRSLNQSASSFLEEQTKRLDKLNAERASLQDALVHLPDVQAKVEEYRSRLNNWESVHCPSCNSPIDHEEKAVWTQKHHDLIFQLKGLQESYRRLSKLDREIATEKGSTNHYRTRAEEERNRKNPFLGEILNTQENIKDLESQIEKVTSEIDRIKIEVSGLETVLDLAGDLRAELVRKAVKTIERETNRRLDTYFDAEIRVEFSVEGDDLNVGLYKSGNECKYAQLSKGQRGLLKLAFSTSVMGVAANNSGVHFNALFFDEALDGFDSSLKVKAFSLFQELEKQHGSIFVIDHSEELKSCFSKSYIVKLVGDKSELENNA